MNLLAPLAAGFADASAGFADIYLRGTSTRASYYASFEGDNQVTPTASIPLDANGRLVAYVNVVVDCVIKDSTGTIRCQFTAGETATSTEVRSPSFTGTDYETGVAAASQPNDLETILDKWVTSAGAIDWNVLVGGSSVSIQNALSSLGGLFFNVKATTYGAVGDGVSDDRSAIAAALTAASNGGVVYFPPGTYRITSNLTVGAKVSLMGAGPGASILTVDHATNKALAYSAASTNDWQFIRDLTIKVAQSNSSDLIYVSANVKLRIDNCLIGDALITGRCVHVDTGAEASILNVTSSTLSTSATAFLGTVGYSNCIGCRFILPTGAYNAVTWTTVKGGTVAFCEFENATITSGTFANLDLQSGTGRQTVCVGNYFPDPTGGTCVPMQYTDRLGIVELGNTYGSASHANIQNMPQATTLIGASGMNSINLTREYHKFFIATDALTTLDPDKYAFATLARSTNADQTVQLTAPRRAGQLFTFAYYNGSGGNIATVTLTTVKGLATFALNAGLTTVVHCIGVESNGSLAWAGSALAAGVTI